MNHENLSQRLNFYTLIHKALRYKLYQYAQDLGQSCFLKQEIDELKRRFEEIAEDLNRHAHHEDTYLHPFIKKYLAQDVSKMDDEHAAIDSEQAMLLEQVACLSKETDQTKRLRMGQQFYLAYNAFVSKFVMHMHHEEFVVMPKLWALCSDQQLQEPHLAVVKSIPPEQMAKSIQLFNLALNAQEKQLFA